MDPTDITVIYVWEHSTTLQILRERKACRIPNAVWISMHRELLYNTAANNSHRCTFCRHWQAESQACKSNKTLRPFRDRNGCIRLYCGCILSRLCEQIKSDMSLICIVIWRKRCTTLKNHASCIFHIKNFPSSLPLHHVIYSLLVVMFRFHGFVCG